MAPNPDLPDLETLLERPAAAADDDAFGRVAVLLQAAADVDDGDGVDEALLTRLRDHGGDGPRRLATVLSLKTVVVAGTLALTTTAAAAGGHLPDPIQAPVERLMRRAVPVWAAEHEPPVPEEAPASARRAAPRVGNGIGTEHDVANRGQHRAQPTVDATPSAAEHERSTTAPSAPGPGQDRSSETPAGPRDERPGQRQGPPAAVEPGHRRPWPEQGEHRQPAPDPPRGQADAAPQPPEHAQPAPPAEEHSAPSTQHPGHGSGHVVEKE